MTTGSWKKAISATAAVCLASVVAGCAPTLRDVDVNALTHVQGDLERRYKDPATQPGDKLMYKTSYCEIDAVVVAAGKKDADKAMCP